MVKKIETVIELKNIKAKKKETKETNNFSLNFIINPAPLEKRSGLLFYSAICVAGSSGSPAFLRGKATR